MADEEFQPAPEDEGVAPPEDQIQYDLPPVIHEQTAAVEARLAGYGWDEILGHINQSTETALQSGYSQDEINEFLGYQPASRLSDRLSTEAEIASVDAFREGFEGDPVTAASRGFVKPSSDPDMPDLGRDGWGNLAQTYARAVTNGETTGPQNFASAYLRGIYSATGDLFGNPALEQNLARMLPSPEDATDHAIALVKEAGHEVEPGLVAIAREQLLDRWADTGASLTQTLNDAKDDPMLADTLTRPRVFKVQPTMEELSVPGRDTVVDPFTAVGENIWEGLKAIVGSDPEVWKKQEDWENKFFEKISPNPETGEKMSVGQALEEVGKSPVEFMPGGEAIGAGQVSQRFVKLMEKFPEAQVTPGVVREQFQKAVTQEVDQITMESLRAEAMPGVERAAPAAAETRGAAPGETVFSYLERQKSAIKDEMPEATAAERSQTLLERIQQTISDLGADESGAVRNFFSTAAQDARRQLNYDTAVIAREDIEYHALGQARAERAIAAARLEHFSKETEKLVPQHLEAIEDMRTSGRPRLDDPLTAMKAHIEDGTGKIPNPFAVEHPLHQLAATMRDIVQDVRTRLEANPLFTKMGFVEDYMRHLWTNPNLADQVYGIGRQGSAASTLARRIPTELDGILQGLVPKIANPVANTLHYVRGMLDYEASLNILQHGKDLGHIKYGLAAPEEGWIRLKGRAAEVGTSDGGVLYAWAPSGYARVYNSWAGKGFYDHAWGGPIYRALQRAANMSVGFKLSLSPFHLMTMAQEAGISGISRAIADVRHGEILNAAKDLGMSAAVFPELASKVAYGRHLGEVYLEKIGGSAMDREVMKLWRDVGGAPAGHGQGIIQGQMQTSARDNMVRAFRQGRLGREIREDASRVLGREDEAVGTRIVKAPFRAVGFGLDQIGRTMQTINGPLFDAMIPHLKRGAFGAELADWLRRNPNATVEAQRARARELRKAVDDRFGELDQDHLFWNRYLKQTLNLFSVSLGWEYGALRTFGAAARDTAVGRPIDSARARWLPAFLAMTALQNNVIQYLHTGTFTWQTDTPWRDSFLAARTSEDGSHRSISPGYQKEMIAAVTHALATPDFMGALQEVGGYFAGKINPFWQMVQRSLTDKDWDDKSIRAKLHAALGAPPAWWQYAGYILTQGLSPIGIEALAKRKADEPMSPWTQFLLAQRPAGKAITDPAGYRASLEKVRGHEVEDAARLMQRQNRALETPDPDVEAGTSKALAEMKALLAKDGGGGGSRSGGQLNTGRGGGGLGNVRLQYGGGGSPRSNSELGIYSPGQRSISNGEGGRLAAADQGIWTGPARGRGSRRPSLRARAARRNRR